MSNCVRRIYNSFSKGGTTAFERIFLAQQPWSPAESIRAIAELHSGEPDFSLDDVWPNIELALQEHPRLSQVISDRGLWTTVKVELSQHVIYLSADQLQGSADATRQSEFEEPPGLLAAMSEMAAFKAVGRPLWQIIVTPRKLVIDIHHGLVDGVGLAVIAATVFEGKTMAEANASLCKLATAMKSKRSSAMSSCSGCCFVGLKCLACLPRYLAAPLTGLLRPEPKSAVFSTRTNKMKASRLMHLGPYDTTSLKNAAKLQQTTLNGLLLATVNTGIQDYCLAKGGDSAALPIQVAVPVSFKRPDPNDLDKMSANNSFSTTLVRLQSRGAFSVDLGEACAARTSQDLLSYLPLPIVQWLYVTASRLVSYIFSNVDGNWASGHFMSLAASSSNPRRVSVYAYGAPPAEISLFVLANSHGRDLHIGITACQYIEDPASLATTLHAALSKLTPSGDARHSGSCILA